MLAFEGLTVMCAVGLDVAGAVDCESAPQPAQTASAAITRRNPAKRAEDVNFRLQREGKAQFLNIIAS